MIKPRTDYKYDITCESCGCVFVYDHETHKVTFGGNTNSGSLSFKGKVFPEGDAVIVPCPDCKKKNCKQTFRITMR